MEVIGSKSDSSETYCYEYWCFIDSTEIQYKYVTRSKPLSSVDITGFHNVIGIAFKIISCVIRLVIRRVRVSLSKTLRI